MGRDWTRDMKRFGFALMMVLALLLGLAGCQGGKPSGGSASAPGATADGKKLKIGVSIPAADHGWTAGVVWWANEYAKMNPNVEWTITTANTPAKQIADIETLMVAGVDGLVILATESAPITPVAKKAKEAGIFIVNVDRGFLEPVADIFLEGDNKAFGRKSAQFIVDKLGGTGKIVILEGIPSTVNTDRVNAAMEVFKANPGIEIVGQASGMWNQAKSLEVMQTLLLKAPKIDAVWASDDDMALGAEKAIKEANRDKEMWILGGAGMKDIVKRVMDKDPMYPGNVTYPPSMIAMGMQLAAASLGTGKENSMKFTPRHLMIDVEVITPENAKDYYFPDSIF